MIRRSFGPEPGELRGIAALSAIVFGVVAYGHCAGIVLSPQPSAARDVPQAAVTRRTKELAAPERLRHFPEHLFWLSRAFRPGDPRLVDVVGAGDIMMGSPDYGLNPALRPDVNASLLVGGNIAAVFRRADIAFANLEGPLYDGDGAPSKDCDHCYTFRSPTYYARYLAQLEIRAVSLANNHSGDYGETGRDSTIAALRDNGIGSFGLDRDGARVAEFTLADGTRAALVSFAPNAGTLDINDPNTETGIIRSLKKSYAIVIVSFHGGGEGDDYSHVADAREYFHGEDRGNVVEFAHTAIDAGADIVIGQGPHVPRALEIRHGHLIAYSLGNFWTYGAIDTSAIRGAGPVLEAWLAPDGTIAGFAIHSTEQRGFGVPRLDPAKDAEHAMLALTRADFPATAAMLDSAERTREIAHDGDALPAAGS